MNLVFTILCYVLQLNNLSFRFADDSSDEDESLSMGDEAAYNLFSPERVRSGLNEDQMMLYEMGGQT